MLDQQRSWRYAAIAILCLGGFPLIFAGVAGFDSNMGDTLFQGGAAAVVEVGDAKVSAADFLNIYNQQVSSLSREGVAPTAAEIRDLLAVVRECLDEIERMLGARAAPA